MTHVHRDATGRTTKAVEQPKSLSDQLADAVEALGVEDVAAAFREIRDARDGKEEPR